MSARVLIVDDDATLRRALGDRLRHWGFAVDDAADGHAAVKRAADRAYDVVLMDLAMPRMGGLEAMRRLAEAGCEADVIVLTAHGSVDAAVEAMKAGAFDFLQKPADFDLLRARIERALEGRRQGRMVRALSDRVPDEASAIVGDAPAMRRLLETAARAARSEATVLITGESGSGKQVIAEYVHAQGPRAGGPFVYVNCVALSDELVESTLFGHVKGAFTGAIASKEGRLELAANGTAFLDEIGDTTPRLQTKLLHFLESGEYERVGDTRTRSTDCRIVAATNRDLPAAVKTGAFRADLYYRLNVIHLEVPPLRARREDVPALVGLFVRRFAGELGRGPTTVAARTLDLMVAHDWPGNVRQLRNLVERMVVLAPEDEITPDLLPSSFFGTSEEGGLDEGTLPYKEAVQAFKKRYLAQALDRAQGNQTQAAEALGMQRTFLNRLVKDLGLRPDGP